MNSTVWDTFLIVILLLDDSPSQGAHWMRANDDFDILELSNDWLIFV